MMMRYILFLDAQKLAEEGSVVITNDRDDSFTIEEAKTHWENGEVVDCNISFRRLADNDWDVEETRQFFWITDMNESELAITELMGLMKAGADEIIGKGEKIIGQGVTTVEEAPEQKPVKDEDEEV